MTYWEILEQIATKLRLTKDPEIVKSIVATLRDLANQIESAWELKG